MVSLCFLLFSIFSTPSILQSCPPHPRIIATQHLKASQRSDTTTTTHTHTHTFTHRHIHTHTHLAGPNQNVIAPSLRSRSFEFQCFDDNCWHRFLLLALLLWLHSGSPSVCSSNTASSHGSWLCRVLHWSRRCVFIKKKKLVVAPPSLSKCWNRHRISAASLQARNVGVQMSQVSLRPFSASSAGAWAGTLCLFQTCSIAMFQRW